MATIEQLLSANFNNLSKKDKVRVLLSQGRKQEADILRAGGRGAQRAVAEDKARRTAQTNIAGGGDFTVRRGDNLFSIASRIFGSGRFAASIARANNLTSSVILPGQRLSIPILNITDQPFISGGTTGGGGGTVSGDAGVTSPADTVNTPTNTEFQQLSAPQLTGSNNVPPPFIRQPQVATGGAFGRSGILPGENAVQTTSNILGGGIPSGPGGVVDLNRPNAPVAPEPLAQTRQGTAFASTNQQGITGLLQSGIDRVGTAFGAEGNQGLAFQSSLSQGLTSLISPSAPTIPQARQESTGQESTAPIANEPQSRVQQEVNRLAELAVADPSARGAYYEAQALVPFGLGTAGTAPEKISITLATQVLERSTIQQLVDQGYYSYEPSTGDLILTVDPANAFTSDGGTIDLFGGNFFTGPVTTNPVLAGIQDVAARRNPSTTAVGGTSGRNASGSTFGHVGTSLVNWRGVNFG